MFDYATRGFGNGPETSYNSANNLVLVDNPFGLGTGRWAKVISQAWPGDGTVHTFGKAVRAIRDGALHGLSFNEMWIDLPFRLTDDWITHDQGKLGYAWSNPDGVSAGTNPTSKFEFLFHYFSPNNQKINKSEAPWYSVNPNGPFDEAEMLIGLDVYCADDRINTNYSEPIFMRDHLQSSVRKLFTKNQTYILRVHLKLNEPGIENGVLEGWYSENEGVSWTKSVEVLDFNWRDTSSAAFSDEGFVAFRGGNGHGYEVGGLGTVSKNTGMYNAPQETFYFLGDIVVCDTDPFDETTLPISFLSFTATRQNGGARLEWSVASEDECATFLVQKSIDGVNWQALGQQSCLEQKEKTQAHFFDSTFAQLAFYRIRSESLDGKFRFLSNH